jgi:hypothetical protein
MKSIKFQLRPIPPSHSPSDGGMASAAYFKMNDIQDPADLRKLRSALLTYCRLDTLAMVKILEKLREM